MPDLKSIKYYNIKAIALGIIIFFVFNKAEAQVPLSLPAIPEKVTCDNDFYVHAKGGTGKYIYSSSIPSIATVNASSGYVHLTGITGTTFISVTDGISFYPKAILQVNPALPPAITITPTNPSPCQGVPVTFTAHVANARDSASFQWQVNGVNAGTDTDIFVGNNLQSGDKIACILSNNTNHCIPPGFSSNSATVTLVPITTPEVTIASSAPGAVDVNTPVTFTATSTNAGNQPVYQWYINNTPVGESLPQYTTSCFYNGDIVTCVVTNIDGICLSSFTGTSNAITVSVTNSAIPTEATVSVSDNKVYTGENVSFIALVKNGKALGYQWQINGEDIPAATDSVYSTYRLKNGDKVSCIVATDNKCNPLFTTNTITMSVVAPPQITIPNTFTPNGDNINDYWEIKNLNLYRYCQVSVFNRYGALVFRSTGYQNPWDGKYKNSNLSTGTYYYIIDLGIHTRLLSGPVTILR